MDAPPSVKEDGSDHVTISVSLSSKPTSDVKLSIAVTDDSELKSNKKILSITPDYWNIAQQFKVTGVSDDIIDGNIKSNVVIKATSDDPDFNNKSKEIEFTTVDLNKAGFKINSTKASLSENSGMSVSMTISLTSRPTADVKVTATSTDPTELQVTIGSTLTFTQISCYKPQTVTAKVLDDSLPDGTQQAQIKFVAESLDNNYNGISDYSAVYSIIDNDD